MNILNILEWLGLKRSTNYPNVQLGDGGVSDAVEDLLNGNKLGLADRALGYAFGGYAQELANKGNKEVHQMDNQFNAEQAELTREWNSIAAQMQRASSAGVNPISIAMAEGGMNFGGTSSAQASAASPLGMIANSQGLVGAIDAITNSQQHFEMAITERNTRAAKLALIQAETKEMVEKARETGLSADYQAKLVEYYVPMAEADIQAKKAMAGLTLAQTDQINQSIEAFKEQLPLILEGLQLDNKVTRQSLSNLFKEASEIDSRTRLNNANSELVGAETEGQKSENTIISAQASVEESRLAKMLDLTDATIKEMQSKTGLNKNQAIAVLINALNDPNLMTQVEQGRVRGSLSSDVGDLLESTVHRAKKTLVP